MQNQRAPLSKNDINSTTSVIKTEIFKLDVNLLAGRLLYLIYAAVTLCSHGH